MDSRRAARSALSRLQPLLDAAAATGTLTAIATGGALLGLGWREGEVGRAFRLAGRAVLERFGVGSAAAPLTSVTVGYLQHLLVATAWGAVLALCVLPFRGVARLLLVVAAAAGYALLSLTVVPTALRIGAGVTGTVPGTVTIALTLAVALLGGGWVADGDGH
jgi:hypothetical protein